MAESIRPGICSSAVKQQLRSSLAQLATIQASSIPDSVRSTIAAAVSDIEGALMYFEEID